MTISYPSGAQVILAPDATPDQWHAARATGLGGSDMAAICGLDKWTSPLEVWHRKAGRDVPRRRDAALEEAALMGHLLEPIVAHRFADLTGLPVLEGPGTLQAIDPEWGIANLDGAVLEDGRYGVFEAKTRSSYALEEWLDEPPAGPYLQVQHYLMVTGWTFGYIACLIGGQRTIVHRVDRDDDLIDGLRTIGTEFMEQVRSDTPPPVDGTDATRDLLHRLHPDANGEVVVGDAAEVEKWLTIRATAKEQAAAADIALTDAENHLKSIAGNATEVHIRGQLAYSWANRRGQISWKAAALDLDPDLDPEPYRGAPTRHLTIHLEV